MTYPPIMLTKPPTVVLQGRRDRLWLPKRFCEHSGLRLTRISRRSLRFGAAAYEIEIPADLSGGRAFQIARRIRASRKLLRLGHLANRLLAHCGREDRWRYRGPKLKVR